MLKIQQLIQDMCPNGVDWKKLGDLGLFENTGVDKKSRDDEQEVTLLNFMDVCRHKYIDASIPSMVVTAPDKKIVQCNVLKDDIFITPSSETIDEIGFAAVIMEDLPNVVYSYHIMRYRLNQPNTTTAKYIRYLFEAPIVRKQILKSAKGLTRFGLSKYQFADIEIPLPPLEIQKKIVECLDKFSALAAELQAELQKRRTQYEYYRTRLLTPPPTENISSDNSTDESKWENVKFSDVASYIRGVTYNKHDELHEQSDSAIKVLRANNITLESNSLNLDEVKLICSDVRVKQEQYLRKNDIFICAGSGSKEHVGKVAFINEDMDYTFGGFMGVVRTREKVTSKFLYYILTSNIFKEYLIGALNSTTINNLNNTIMSEFSFMVPPLAEQERIVSILDKFEALTSSLSDGIPAEQAAQKKRYEYYRDKLLTFEKRL